MTIALTLSEMAVGIRIVLVNTLCGLDTGEAFIPFRRYETIHKTTKYSKMLSILFKNSA